MKNLNVYLLSLLSLLFIYQGTAQEIQVSGDLKQEVPVDPKIRMGKLENGLTYYIRKNSKPEEKIEFRLVVNAGSILEDEDQLGLAHFVEHMAFNGTKNFKKNDLINYLQSIGVEFGADLNAYTSFDETVYMLPIPTGDKELVDKGLLVLEDWASGLLFDPEEIDKERGVVTEEWRLGRGADQRMRDQWFPEMFKNSLYADRLPIGTKEIIQNASYEAVERFYKDWYRPNLMAIVAIGDLDPDEMEAEIKERFGKLENPKNERERTFAPVPDHEETFVSVVSDKEASFTQIQLVYKLPIEEQATLLDYRKRLVYSLYNQMLNQRLNELRQSPEPPFIFAGTGYGNMVRTKSDYSSFALVGETEIENGLKTLIRENERVKQFGFTAGELERAKKSRLNDFEKGLKEVEKTESRAYASEYIRNFLRNEPIPGIAFEYDFAKEVFPSVTLEEVNALASQWIGEYNRVVVVTGPEKEGLELPSQEDILGWLKNAGSEQIEAYEDKVSGAKLLEAVPAKGTIVKENYLESVGITEFELSNGARVIVKPTDFKNDQIVMAAYSYGGHSIYADEDYRSASSAGQIIAQSGVGEFSPTDLTKLFAGKTIRVSPFVGMLSEGLRGNTSPKDLEESLQLLHLFFTNPKKDEGAFKSYKTRNAMLYQNLMSNPQFFFQDQATKILSQNHLRASGFPTPEDMEKINFERSYEIYKERFNNAGDFVFMFVGAFEVEQLKPLLETYIASLPASDEREMWSDLGIRPPKGKVEETIKKGTDPKSLVRITFTGDLEYTKENDYYLTSLGQVLSNRLIDVIREEKSGVYGVGARGSASKNPVGRYSFNITFPCGPENVESLVQATMDEIEKIKKDGVSEEELNEVKEAQRINREESLKKNEYWLNAMRETYFNEGDITKFYEMEDMMKALSQENIKATANQFLDTESFIKIVLVPEQ